MDERCRRLFCSPGVESTRVRVALVCRGAARRVCCLVRAARPAIHVAVGHWLIRADPRRPGYILRVVFFLLTFFLPPFFVAFFVAFFFAIKAPH